MASLSDAIIGSDDDTSLHAPVFSDLIPLQIVYPHQEITLSCKGTNTTGQARYALRSLGPIQEDIVMVKKPYSLVKVTKAVVGITNPKVEIGCLGSVNLIFVYSLKHIFYHQPASGFHWTSSFLSLPQRPKYVAIKYHSITMVISDDVTPLNFTAMEDWIWDCDFMA
ncbi:hypothetical protein Tco_0958825 [Tanacetum coccineum]